MISRLPTLVPTGLALLAALASAVVTFAGKNAAENDAEALARLDRSIAAERQRISELRAEWSALDHPARLQRLYERHGEALGLAPIAPEQIATIGAVALARQRHAELQQLEEAER